MPMGVVVQPFLRRLRIIILHMLGYASMHVMCSATLKDADEIMDICQLLKNSISTNQELTNQC